MLVRCPAPSLPDDAPEVRQNYQKTFKHSFNVHGPQLVLKPSKVKATCWSKEGRLRLSKSISDF